MNKGGSNFFLVIPCFNESGRIGDFLNDLCSKLQTLESVNILVVDDGSGNAEQNRMKNLIDPLRSQFPFLLEPLFLPGNLGKGGAVYAGWKHGHQAAWLGFVDADGSCSATEVLRLVNYAKKLPDSITPPALFASRVKMLGRQVERDFKRHLLGRVYATLVSEILKIPVYDSQCGLKLIPQIAYAKIEPRLFIQEFAFDVDLMVNLIDAGYSIEEFPIDWHETAGGKVKLLSDSWRMFRDVMKIKKNRISKSIT